MATNLVLQTFTHCLGGFSNLFVLGICPPVL